jgi:GT2 family glycosyltransferase
MSCKYDVSVILVNYNGKKYIDGLFQSLVKIKHEDFSYEIVFEDNNSSDDSVEYLRKSGYGDKCNLKIVESKDNLGFAGGNNLAIDNAEGEYIILLNNDTAVDENWLSEIYHFIKDNKECGMVNSKLVFFYDFIKLTFTTQDKVIIDRNILINGSDYKIDNKFCKNVLCQEKEVVCFGHSEIYIPLLDGKTTYAFNISVKEADDGSTVKLCGESFNTDKTINIEFDIKKIEDNKVTLIQNAGSGINENYDGYDIGFCDIDGDKYNKPYEINNGCGASIIMLKEDFIKCGKFDERFFMYYEDTDLSYRIKKLNKKIMYCPTSIVRHIHTGSSTEWSPFFIYHVYRNKLLFIKNNVSTGKYFKYFLKQCKQAIKERSKIKLRGTFASLKVICGFKAKY